MRYFEKLATLAFALLVAAGCDAVPTAQQSGDPAPRTGITDGPASPGQSPVFRFTLPGTGGWVILVDADTKLAFLGSGVDAIREGDDDPTTPELDDLCPGEAVTESNPLPFQAVTTRSGVQNLVGTGDLFSWVYDVRGHLPPDFPDAPIQDASPLFTCGFLTGDAMMAKGLLATQQTVSSSPSGRTSVVAKGHGRLDDLINGGKVSTNLKLHTVVNGGGELVRLSVIVRLSPDPRF